jgi:hypothetical protein
MGMGSTVVSIHDGHTVEVIESRLHAPTTEVLRHREQQHVAALVEGHGDGVNMDATDHNLTTPACVGPHADGCQISIN